ncbi:MAG: GHMP kinase [Chloroflexi bacterium]|nr:GHMP kinase [Chloroflexota bacterium]MCL5109095.1 GHMP kinase [Chloroflexota bacterium]
MKATVYLPGTCGELVQGLSDGRHFLVSCPLDLYAEVTVELLPDGGSVQGPADAPKAGRALALGLAYLGLPGLGARLSIRSPLPRSKGLGSSTADVAGALYALARAGGRWLRPEEVAGLALAVEPTNSSLFPHLTLFDHRQGTLCEDLGPAPAAAVLVLDCGGEVDTLAYNAVDRRDELLRLSPRAERALALLRAGLRRRDLRLLGQAATESALAHQRILPKPELREVLRLGQALGGAGVCIGHSGTVIGVIFPVAHHGDRTVAERFQRELPQLALLGWHRLVNGGCSPMPPATSRPAVAAALPGVE